MTQEEMLQLPEVQAEIERVAQELWMQWGLEFSISGWDALSKLSKDRWKQSAISILFGKDSKLAVRMFNQEIECYEGNRPRAKAIREMKETGFVRVAYVGL